MVPITELASELAVPDEDPPDEGGLKVPLELAEELEGGGGIRLVGDTVEEEFVIKNGGDMVGNPVDVLVLLVWLNEELGTMD